MIATSTARSLEFLRRPRCDCLVSSIPEAPPTCSSCGRVANRDVDGDPPLAWSLELGPDRRRRWTCELCSRRYVRSIEAKLDEQYWD
jgi:hypothetical protein